MRSWWGEGVGSRIAYPVVSAVIRPAYFYSVSDALVGVAFSGLLPYSRLVDTVTLCWVLLRCRSPCHVPFVENVGCWVAEMPSVVGIVPISGGWAAVPASSVLGPLGVPAITARGPLGVHSCSCSGVVPWNYLILHLTVLWLHHLHRVNRWSAFTH